MALNIESKNISIYPTAYRQYKDGDNVTQAVDFTSRLNTEFNMTKNLKALSSLNDGSFVIGYDTTGQSHTIEFYLKGYFFQIRDFVPEANKELYVSLTTKNFSDSNYKNLIEVVPFDTDPAIDTDRDLDDLNSTDNKVYFNGLGFSNASGDLKLLNSDGSVPKESYWKYQFKDIKTDLTEDLEITNTQKTKFKNGNNEIELNNTVGYEGIKLKSGINNYIVLDENTENIDIFSNNSIGLSSGYIDMRTDTYNYISLGDPDYGIEFRGSGLVYDIYSYGCFWKLLNCDVDLELDSLTISSNSININSNVGINANLGVTGTTNLGGNTNVAGNFGINTGSNLPTMQVTSTYGFNFNTAGKNFSVFNGNLPYMALVGSVFSLYGSQTSLTNADTKFTISGSPAGNSNKVKFWVDPEAGEQIIEYDDTYYTGDILIQRNGKTPISLFDLNDNFLAFKTFSNNSSLRINRLISGPSNLLPTQADNQTDIRIATLTLNYIPTHSWYIKLIVGGGLNDWSVAVTLKMERNGIKWSKIQYIPMFSGSSIVQTSPVPSSVSTILYASAYMPQNSNVLQFSVFQATSIPRVFDGYMKIVDAFEVINYSDIAD